MITSPFGDIKEHVHNGEELTIERDMPECFEPENQWPGVWQYPKWQPKPWASTTPSK